MTNSDRHSPGLSRARRVTAAVALALVGGAALQISMSRNAASDPVRTALVDLNSATEHELQLLPNVGPAIAARIVAEREKNGPYARVDDLARVPGVGERTVRRLRDHATVGP